MTSKENVSEERKLRIRMRFRYVVRRVIENLGWLSPTAEVTRQAQAIKAGYIPQRFLNNRIRQILLKAHHLRTAEEIEKIVLIVERIPTFKHYSNEIHKQLAKVADFLYLKEGRTLMRMGDPPVAAYAILSGMVGITRMLKEENGGTYEDFHRGYRGKTFGDYSLVYNTMRKTTVVTIVGTELLVFNKVDFDKILTEKMLKQWTTIKNAIARYDEYFGSMDFYDVKNLCTFGKITHFQVGDIIFDWLNLHSQPYAYFLLRGKCDLLEVLEVCRMYDQKGDEFFVKPTESLLKYHYENTRGVESHVSLRALKELRKEPGAGAGVIGQTTAFKLEQHGFTHSGGGGTGNRESVDNKPRKSKLETLFMEQGMRRSGASAGQSSMKSDDIEIPSSRKSSVAYLNRRDTAVASALQTGQCKSFIKDTLEGKNSSRISSNPTGMTDFLHTIPLAEGRTSGDFHPGGMRADVEKHFIKVCSYQDIGCFNIGENIRKRLMYCATDVDVLQFPKIVLFRDSMSMWKRIARYINATLPTTAQLFEIFVRNRVYRFYKKQLLDSILKKDAILRSHNSLTNVPFSIRIRQDFQFSDEMVRLQQMKKQTKKTKTLTQSTTRKGKMK